MAGSVDQRIEELYDRHRALPEGAVASYYDSTRGSYGPEEAGPERDLFAISFTRVPGDVHTVGACESPFLLQSISKLFAYALALADNGRDRVLERVGVEPSGDPYNSIEFDERGRRPFNPMVNAGAMVATDLVQGSDEEEKLERIVTLMRRAAANDELAVDELAAARELRIADRNLATAYLMRSEGMISGDVEAIVSLYLRQCSVAVSCADLSTMAATLANGMICPRTSERVLPVDVIRDVLSVMHTCGMYDAAGQWAFDVGLPAKSGVSGAILAVAPGKGGIGVYSPGLDAFGNSVRGVRVCREVSERLGLHVFASDDEDALVGGGRPRG